MPANLLILPPVPWRTSRMEPAGILERTPVLAA